MALTYSGQLRLALQTLHFIRSDEWPEGAWGEATEANILRRIQHRKKRARAMQPDDIAPAGARYTDALYNAAVLTTKNKFRTGSGKGWSKMIKSNLETAVELSPEIAHYLETHPEKETDDGG